VPGLQASYRASPVGTAEPPPALPSVALSQSSLRDSFLHCRTIPALKCRATFTVSLRDTGGSSVGKGLVSFSVVAVRQSGSMHLRGDESQAYSPVSGSSLTAPEAYLSYSD
jgi:hypothetical protein